MIRPLLSRLGLVAALLIIAVPALADRVMLQARLTNGFLGVDGAGIVIGTAGARDALVFDLIPLQGNRVALRDVDSGSFLRAGVGQQTFLAAASPHIRGWETFEMTRHGADVALRAVQNGLYVGTDGSARLTARWGTRGQGQLFRLVAVGGAGQAAADAPRPIASDLPFAGTWQLDDLFIPGLPDRAMRQAFVTIGRRGDLSGSDGCNTFNATLMAWRSGFQTQNFVMTRRLCHGAVGQIARAFGDTLSEAAHFARVGDRLEIRDRNGRLRARLVRR